MQCKRVGRDTSRYDSRASLSAIAFLVAGVVGSLGGCGAGAGTRAGTGGATSSGGNTAGGSTGGGNGTGGTAAGTGGTAAGTGGAAAGATGGMVPTGGASGGGTGGAGTGGAAGKAGDMTGGASGSVDGGSPDGATGGRGGRGGAGAGGTDLGGDGGATGGRAGAGGAGGGSASDRTAAQVLDGFSILKPCVSTFKPSMNANNSGDCCCEELAANENQHIVKQFGGDASVTYMVKVRIAGVAERYWYSGGMLDATSRLFYTGGLPTIHSTAAPNNNLRAGQGACKIHPPDTDNQFALPFTVPTEIKPSDGCYNGFNIFALTVSSPKQSYYLNYTVDYDNVDRQPHTVYKTDYTVTIPIKGQAQLDFYTVDGDHHQVTNNGTMTVPNLKTTQPYNGNFLEFTVVDVARAN